MSHKPTPYSPNFPQSQGYAQPPEDAKLNESYPMNQQTYAYHQSAGYPQNSGYPPPAPPGPPAPMIPPGALSPQQPGMQPGFQPGFSPNVTYQPGYPAPQQMAPGPVVQQPGPAPGGWMTIPQGLSNCPRGLEYLSTIDQLLVQQNIDMIEAVVGFERKNSYIIKNNVGQNVYHAFEESSWCSRNFFGHLRPFNMRILDNFRNEVMNLTRPLSCDSCCCPCWLQSVQVSSPAGAVLGSVLQEHTLCRPCFSINDAAGNTVLRIKRPVCNWYSCSNVDFKVYSSDGKHIVGKITRQWSGLPFAIGSDADFFGISFPMDLDVKIKAVLLGACFLIDFMFFEK